MADTISRRTRRQYILGRQGLWPGRRWSGKAGIAQALRSVEAVQVDPVTVVAPSADIVLWGRVAKYDPADLLTLLYTERNFFDYGGGLMIYPMTELPYWRVVMERKKSDKRWAEFAAANGPLIDSMRDEVRSRGPLRNRDLTGKSVSHYRSTKDAGVALYYLWLTGEMMTSRRVGKERVYDFLENVAPAAVQHVASEAETDAFFATKAVAELGLVTARSFRNAWRGYTERPVDAKEANAKLAAMLDSDEVAMVNIEGEKEPRYFLAEDRTLLAEIESGRIPKKWKPIETATQKEVTFLSPLEYVSARGRAANLFDFEYIWEIYKPEAKRKYGPYTLPILYGDQLVGRIDTKLDRSRSELRVNGLWFEEQFGVDARFEDALRQGLRSFAHFLSAETVDLNGVVDKAFKVAGR